MRTPRYLPLLAFGAILLNASSAFAFERQWHVGGGMGFAAFAERGVDAGPALGLHGAYGLSDVFDLKVDLLGSTHRVRGEGLSVFSSTAGIAYKMDVIRWVPYAGLEVGYYRLEGARPGNLMTNEAGFSIDLGLDYAVKRSFGLGVQLRYHGFLSDPAASIGDAPLFTGLLRAEYRWGF